VGEEDFAGEREDRWRREEGFGGGEKSGPEDGRELNRIRGNISEQYTKFGPGCSSLPA